MSNGSSLVTSTPPFSAVFTHSSRPPPLLSQTRRVSSSQSSSALGIWQFWIHPEASLHLSYSTYPGAPILSTSLTTPPCVKSNVIFGTVNSTNEPSHSTIPPLLVHYAVDPRDTNGLLRFFRLKINCPRAALLST